MFSFFLLFLFDYLTSLTYPFSSDLDEILWDLVDVRFNPISVPSGVAFWSSTEMAWTWPAFLNHYLNLLGSLCLAIYSSWCMPQSTMVKYKYSKYLRRKVLYNICVLCIFYFTLACKNQCILWLVLLFKRTKYKNIRKWHILSKVPRKIT